MTETCHSEFAGRNFTLCHENKGLGGQMKERPVIIKLNQQCSVEHQGKYGWEPATAYEPIYIAVAHIESFSFGGLTYLKMISGERIQVTETPEEIMAMISGGGA